MTIVIKIVQIAMCHNLLSQKTWEPTGVTYCCTYFTSYVKSVFERIISQPALSCEPHLGCCECVNKLKIFLSISIWICQYFILYQKNSNENIKYLFFVRNSITQTKPAYSTSFLMFSYSHLFCKQYNLGLD